MGAHAVSLGDRLSRPRRARQFVHRLGDGSATSVYVATYPRRLTHPHTVELAPAQPLREWARVNGVADVIAGGFEAGIDDGRHPRAALGLARDRYLAVVCDGYSLRDAGLTLDELAELMTDLGADRFTNLGGGASASLVSAGHLHNRPRDQSGLALLYGRPVDSAVVLAFGR
jgi:Phosphodiester glycosidase